MSTATNTNKGSLCAWTAEQLLARQIPDQEPLVEGLIHSRDLVALGARRRNGKTSFVTNLAVELAVGSTDFLGYRIPKPRRSLLLMLEDDCGEYRDKLGKVIGTRDTGGRIRVVLREDFYAANVPISILDDRFGDQILRKAEEHAPDAIVMDNLAQIVCGDYNDATKIDRVMRLARRLASDHNAALIIPAHPKKEDPEHKIELIKDPTAFFESIMGSSHFINSTGSLWGLQRRDDDIVAFVGGRQRGDGRQRSCFLEMDENCRYRVTSDAKGHFRLVCTTSQRSRAWALLPEPPDTFRYTEAEKLVEPALKKTSFEEWLKDCRRVGLIVPAPDGTLVKGEAGLGREFPKA
jgi:AAA domain-containing protein